MVYYDAIVLGLGGVGSQALRGLARQGRGGRFLGVEGFTLGHTRGSSHGNTRIYRTAYFEHPSYVPWCQYSIKVFEEMEQEHQASFLQPCGTLLMEDSQEPNSLDPASLPPLLKASYDAAQQHEIPVEHLDASALRERYPHFVGTKNMVGLYEPSGGFVRCEQVTKAALKEAQEADHIDILEESRAVGFSYLSDGSIEVSVQNMKDNTDTSDEPMIFQTKKLLMALGGWTGQLIPSWAPHLRPIRQLQSFLQVPKTLVEQYSHDEMPTWVMIHPDYHLPQYGIPCDKNEPGCEKSWLKIAIHGRDDFLPDPSLNAQNVTPEEAQEALEASSLVFDCAQFAQEMHGSSAADSSTAFATIVPCIYTMTKDAHFILGTPEGYPNIFAVAGLSGHGYKMAPALGQMMVDYALDNDMSKWNMEFCSPSRFGV